MIITWKTMCSQICSHWLLLSSSHLVFSLIMIQILWKKSQIVNYKHAQRYDNHFYQVWRFENFCDSSNNLKYHSPPKANTSHDLIHWVLHKMNCYKTSFLSHHYVLIQSWWMQVHIHVHGIWYFSLTIQMINTCNWRKNTCDLWPHGTIPQWSCRWCWQGRIFGGPGFPWTNEWWPVGSLGYRRLVRTQV